jgi:hypothetical protein
VTVTSTTPPVVVAGEIAVMDVSVAVVLAVKLVAGTPPKSTAVAPVKPVPVIVTDVPPVVAPLFGETEVTVGAVPVAASVLKVRTSPGVHVVPPSVEDHAAK